MNYKYNYNMVFNPFICSVVKLSGYSISNSIIKFPDWLVFSLKKPLFGIIRLEFGRIIDGLVIFSKHNFFPFK